MRRLMVQLPEDLYEALRARAAAEGVSAAEVIRRALRAYVPADLWGRALRAVGCAEDPAPDVAERHDAYLEEVYGDR